jgi:hypothetical protein
LLIGLISAQTNGEESISSILAYGTAILVGVLPTKRGFYTLIHFFLGIVCLKKLFYSKKPNATSHIFSGCSTTVQ